MRFKQDDAIFTLNNKSLKLFDYFTYQSSDIPSTESDVNILIWEVWIAIDRLLTIIQYVIYQIK